jgi:hypothetical protein
MYVIKRTSSTLLLVVLLLALMPVQAQGPGLLPEELEWIEYVGGAIDNLDSLDSYTVYGTQTMSQDMSLSSESVHTDMAGDLTWQIRPGEDGNPEAAKGAVRMNMSFGGSAEMGIPTSMKMTVEYIVRDNMYYVRYDFDPSEDDMGLGDSWMVFSLDEMLEQYRDVLGLGKIDIETLMQLSGSNAIQYVIPVNAGTVRQIAEIEGETIDGQEMRVFDININYARVMPESYVQMIGGILDSSGLVSQGFDPDIMLQQIFEEMNVQQRIWIDVDNYLPYRVEFSIELDMSEMLKFIFESTAEDTSTILMQQQHSINTTFSAFNEPFEVEAPGDAISFIENFFGAEVE